MILNVWNFIAKWEESGNEILYKLLVNILINSPVGKDQECTTDLFHK